MELTLAQQQIVEDMHDYGIEQEIIDLISNPELTPTQMNDLMWRGQSSYLLGFGDPDYDPEDEKAELAQRIENISARVKEYLNENEKRTLNELDEVLSGEPRFRYQLLGRLQRDCEHYLGYGQRNDKHLWAGNVRDQIKYMKAIWNSFPEGEKPQWLSVEQIEGYEEKMNVSPVRGETTRKLGDNAAEETLRFTGKQAEKRKEYSPEEKAAYKKERRDEVEQLTAKMEQGIKEIAESGRFREYLDMQRKFHNYSFRNVMLILMQKPDATRVAGFETWKKEFERFVQKGEKGIRIFAPVKYKKTVEAEKVDQGTGLIVRDENGKPVRERTEKEIIGYKAVSVFDVSQTKGKELPETVKAQPLTKDFQGFEKMMTALRSSSPVPIRFESLTDGSNGYYDLKKKEIVICTGMSEAQTIKTTIHEIAHAQLHDYDLKNSDGAKERTDRDVAELEAESVAYVVSGYYGLDTSEYSFAYAANWVNGDMEKVKASMGLISNTSGKMIDQINGGMERERTQEQIRERPQSAERSFAAPKSRQNNDLEH